MIQDRNLDGLRRAARADPTNLDVMGRLLLSLQRTGLDNEAIELMLDGFHERIAYADLWPSQLNNLPTKKRPFCWSPEEIDALAHQDLIMAPPHVCQAYGRFLIDKCLLGQNPPKPKKLLEIDLPVVDLKDYDLPLKDHDWYQGFIRQTTCAAALERRGEKMLVATNEIHLLFLEEIRWLLGYNFDPVLVPTEQLRDYIRRLPELTGKLEMNVINYMWVPEEVD